MTIPQKICINDNECVETNEGWKNPGTVTLADCDKAAKGLNLDGRGVTGRPAVEMILDDIRRSGAVPVWDRDIVDSLRHSVSEGQDWTAFCKNPYNNCGIRRFKRVPVTMGGWVFYAFSNQLGDRTEFHLPNYGKRIYL